jgi:glycogen debranching enzyme
MQSNIEWLETDGLGGFAMGTSDLVPRRRYHALLTSAVKPPTHRMTLVNAVEVIAVVDGQELPLSSLSFGPHIIYPLGIDRITSFTVSPWPTWVFEFREFDIL